MLFNEQLPVLVGDVFGECDGFAIVILVDLHHLDLFANIGLDLFQHGFFFGAAEGYGLAFLNAAARAANAVYVFFGFIGQVVVHYIVYVGDVDAAGIHVGSDQDLDIAFFEFVHHGEAVVLFAAAVHDQAFDTYTFHGGGYTLSAHFGAHKNEDLVLREFFDQAFQEEAFIIHFHKGHGVAHVFGNGIFRGDLDTDGIADDGIGQVLDLGINGSGEEECLVIAAQVFDHIADIADKTEVQHMIGLVQDERLYMGEVQVALADEVEHTSGGGDQYIHAFVQFFDLGILFHAAHKGHNIYPGIFTDLFEDFGDLDSQLAGGHHHQAFYLAFGAGAALLVQQLQYGDGEGGGFAGACLSDGQHIISFQDGWNGLVLNICRAFKAVFCQAAFDLFCDAVLFEFHEGTKVVNFGQRVFWRRVDATLRPRGRLYKLCTFNQDRIKFTS